MAKGDVIGKGKKFSKENQPDPKAKKQGHIKKRVLKDIASQIVKGDSIKDLKPLASYLGIPENEIDVETLMHLAQMSKAIKEQDTRAYNAVMDRLKGKPKQEVDHTTNGQSFNKPLLEIDPLKDD